MLRCRVYTDRTRSRYGGFDVIRYDMIYFLTVIGLTPDGSSTVHIYLVNYWTQREGVYKKKPTKFAYTQFCFITFTQRYSLLHVSTISGPSSEIKQIQYTYIYRVSQKEWTKLRESVPYVKLYRYNPKHLYPKLNGYGDNCQRSLKLWQLLHTYCLPNSY